MRLTDEVRNAVLLADDQTKVRSALTTAQSELGVFQTSWLVLLVGMVFRRIDGLPIRPTTDFDTLTLLNQRMRCTLQDVITYHLITIKDCTPVQYKNPPDGQCVRGIFVV
jgi:hypothetical protein